MEYELFSYPPCKGFFSFNTHAHRQPTGQITGLPTCPLQHVSKNLPAVLNKYTHHLHTNSCSWEADSHSASQEIPCLLWNLCSQETITGPYHENALNTVTSYFTSIHFSITLLSMSRCSQVVSSLHCLHSNYVCTYHLFTYTPWHKMLKIDIVHISVLLQVHLLCNLHISKKAWYHWKDTFIFLILYQPQ